MKKRMVLIFMVTLAGLFLLNGVVTAQTRIRCASTTSTQNSGLLDYLLPLFEKKTGISPQGKGEQKGPGGSEEDR
ncbi:MAG: hypothetical protein MUF69_11570 [Desulfobacterota bacterium]|nr:hypothetical protein [Thermodesulfobacteriota bacterium]